MYIHPLLFAPTSIYSNIIAQQIIHDFSSLEKCIEYSICVCYADVKQSANTLTIQLPFESGEKRIELTKICH